MPSPGSPPSLVLGSDFCRPAARRRRGRRRVVVVRFEPLLRGDLPPADDDDDDEPSPEAAAGTGSSAEAGRRRPLLDQRHGPPDAAAAYASSTNVLRRIGTTAGRLAWMTLLSETGASGGGYNGGDCGGDDLSFEDGDDGEENRPAVAVRLMYLPQQSTTRSDDKQQAFAFLDDETDDGEDDDEYLSQPQLRLRRKLPVVRLSPLAAANLGIDARWFRIGGKESGDCGGAGGGAVGAVEACWEDVPEAASVRLRYWARPGRPVPLLGKGRRRTGEGDADGANRGREVEGGEEEEEEEDDRQQWPLPPPGTVLQRGSIAQVSKGGEAYLYEILDVECGGKRADPDTDASREDGKGRRSAATVALAGRRTRYALEAPPTPCVSPLLPPLFAPNTTTGFCCFPSCSSSKASLGSSNALSSFPPHPDVPQLVQAFTSPVATPAACLISLVGTDSDHDVSVGVRAAAALSGRRYLSVKCGWTAFAFLMSKPSSNGSITNGSLADKLLGLDLALQHAHRHSPCVLQLYLDREITASSSHEKHDRHDQEGRVISLLLQHSIPSARRLPRRYGQQAPVLVVLSTRRPLPPDGPLRQRLVRPVLEATFPQDEYVSYLCCREAVDDRFKTGESRAAALPLLRGRPAEDIVLLWKECQQQLVSSMEPYCSKTIAGKKCSDEALTVRHALLDCCHRHDRDRRRQQSAHIPAIRWADVGNVDHVRSELLDALELPLKYPHLIAGNDGRGLLLYGPPGVGKTLIAKAVATECNLPFLSVKGPELLGSYVGESEKNVREVFARARNIAAKNTPPASVLFFDELDSLAPRRGGQSSGGGSVMDRVVASLFAELDEKRDTCIVFVLGATNRPDLLDPALLRPGRLDRKIYLGLPQGVDEQSQILKKHLSKLRLNGDASELAEAVAQNLGGRRLTGADLSVVASAALLTATERLCQQADQELVQRQQGGEQITLDQVLQSWDEDRLEPVVTLSDLLEASKNVMPSVSAEEIERYEQLSRQFGNAPTKFP